MTKTLKPVLAMSVAALTLLAGCAKGEVNTAWSKTKTEVKKTYNVKSFDVCDYIHFDAKKTENSKDQSNAVGLSFTFTLNDGKQVSLTSYYVVKEKELYVGLASTAAYTAMYAASKIMKGYTTGSVK